MVVKSEFVYKPIPSEKILERANRSRGNFDSYFKTGFPLRKVLPGNNCHRILPPTWEDYAHYAYMFFLHYNVGPKNQRYICPKGTFGDKCPICEAHDAALRAGEKKEAKELEPRERYLAWVLDRDGEKPDQPLLWEFSKTVDQEINAQTVHPRTRATIAVEDPQHGYDLMFTRVGTGLEDTKYFGWQFEREPSKFCDDPRKYIEIYKYITANPIPSVLNVYDYAYLKGVMSGMTVERDPEIDAEDEPPFEVAPSRRNGNGHAEPEPVDEPVNEEIEEAPPPRRTRPQVMEEPRPRRQPTEDSPPPRRRMRV